MINILAYIDPGTTALIWQIVAGVFIAFGVVLGIWWRKISTFFKSVWVKIFGKKKNAGETDNSEEDEELMEETDEDVSIKKTGNTGESTLIEETGDGVSIKEDSSKKSEGTAGEEE